VKHPFPGPPHKGEGEQLGTGREIPAGTWVELERVILDVGERAPGIPSDTASVPFAGRVRGLLVAPAFLKSEAQVRTQADRIVSGTLRTVLPRNPANFGETSAELLLVGKAMKARLGADKTG
jgi:2-amino-4-ketopentanoate thiolase alpha subunit